MRDEEKRGLSKLTEERSLSEGVRSSKGRVPSLGRRVALGVTSASLLLGAPCREAQAAEARGRGVGASALVRPQAETATPDDAALLEARAAFARGAAHLERHEYREATMEFEAALKVKRTPGLYYHLAMSLKGAGELLRARAALREAGSFQGTEVQPDVAAALPTALEELESTIPRLTVECAPEGAELTVDGELVRCGRLELDPGVHRLSLRRAGYETSEREVELHAGERRKETLGLAPAGVGEASTSVEPEDGLSSREVVFWSSAVVAVAGAGMGLTGYILAENESSRASATSARIDERSGGSLSACTEPSAPWAEDCDALGSSLGAQSAMRNMTYVGLGAFGVGALGVLATTFLWSDTPVKAHAEVGAGRVGRRITGSF